MHDEATVYLTRILGLCQTPRDQWTPEDQKVFREAQSFVQQRLQKEEKLESKRSGPGSETPGGADGSERSRSSEREVPKDPDALQTGDEDPGQPG